MKNIKLVTSLVFGLSTPLLAQDIPDNIAASVNHADRFEADVARDATRKPAEILAFAGIKPSMNVLDLFSGSGYYTEMVSRAVGAEGSVTSHNNQAYFSFLGGTIDAHYVGNRLPNVMRIKQEANDLALEAESFDVALLVLTYHDFYLLQDGWPEIDAKKVMTEIYKSLKPGGRIVVIDHNATAESGTSLANTMHRIDAEYVKQEIISIGFTFDGSLDVLENKDDLRSDSAFGPNIRGKTDRFVFRFKK